MTSFTDEYATYCATHGAPDRIELLLCDLNAVLRGKWLPGDAADKLAGGAVRLPESAYAPGIMGCDVGGDTGLGIEVGDPDGILMPITNTLRPVPWMPGHVVQVLVEMVDSTGTVNRNSPRALLSGVLDRFRDQGLRPVVATELEFYILQTRKDREDAPQPSALTPDVQNYDMELLARREALLNDILSASAAQGLPTDTLIAEYGPGQFEINFHHTEDVMAAAETALLFRRLVRGVAASHGVEATFMAKPYADQPGNGMHAHVSLIDDNGANIFAASDGVASTLQNAVAGLLDTMRDLQAIFAPHGNSYRRFTPNSFAPATPDWGLDNRAAAVRLPETKGAAARLEHRICGADVNPYLALTAILGGMLHGMKTAPALPAPLDDADTAPAPRLSHDWRSAVDGFAEAPIAQDLFGDYAGLYATVKRAEIELIETPISPVEYSYYLSRF